MSETIRQLEIISRAEFLLPNLGSLIMGLAWGASSSLTLTDIIISVVFSFTIINLSSAIGAQANTLSDHELDLKDDRKKNLVQALESFGHVRLKRVLVVEFAAALALAVVFAWTEAKPVLLFLWAVGISLGYFYSAPPLRIKSRSWQAPVTLILVLAVFPIFFAYLTFTSDVNPLFLLALAGLALTIYGVIIPTEIRDYFGDKAMGVETMTVRLGLAKASLLSMVLLILGGTLMGTAFLVTFAYGQYPLLMLLVLAIVAANSIVLRQFRKLYRLSKEHEKSSNQNAIAEEITTLSANNPKWIMLVTQTYSLISIMMLVTKFLS
ncbi:MAG TPA: UbiA family prenyltransferase [Candidatus Bathyarchaeia archaeon]|jgi:1,4-dihydroxy-2-naphthoate octaprenyltransferase|nr:UbiA family prenyltransferase [Candidatus Bathyarchaeia archaeon]